jgi:DNA-3-methyladenine glycosylase I
VWSYRRDGGAAPESAAELPATTDDSKALARELKRRGFAFVGPTTVYSTMQACGVVNDHLAGCCVRREVERLRR